MPIPDAKIDEIRAAADLVDVAADYVQLKRSGSRYKGLCPFHDENTPSFSIDPDQNLYYCFGCGNGGDVFKFVQDIEGVGFLEAARVLAERYGIPLPEEDGDGEAANERESILHALRFAARFFYYQLTQTDRGEPALDYLRDRGYSPSTIKQFGLGYAPDEWDALLTAAEEEQVDPETLEKAGLVAARESGSGFYDRFRGRVIFPIFSHIGKVLAFAGRLLDESKDRPKYINSPETDVYRKKEVLYGLHQAKRAIRQTNEVLLVEGYTDVISLSQAGVENVVASSGTALTEGQVETVDRYATRVLLLYDSDEAGARAAMRGMDRVLAQGMGAYAVELPEGQDPDDFVQGQGGEAFREYLETHRQDLPSFAYEQARHAGQLETPEDRVDVQRDIIESVAQIPDPNLRREYVSRTSEVVGVPDSDLFRMLEEERENLKQQTKRRRAREARRQGTPQTPPVPEGTSSPSGNGDGARTPPPERTSASEARRKAPKSGPLPEEKVLLRLMLDHGSRMVEFVLGNMALDEFTDGPARELVRTLVEMYQEDAVRPERILDGAHGESLQTLAAGVLMEEHEASENWAEREDIPVPRLNDRPYAAAESAMKLLKLDRVEAAIDEVRERSFEATQAGDEERVQRLQQKMMSLQELRKDIQRGRFLED